MADMMTWRDLWIVALGRDPPVQHFSPVTAAVLVYSLILIMCFIMYRLSFLLPRILQSYAVDFFKSMAFCCYPFGHMIVRTYFGHIGYFCAMVPLVTLSLLVFAVGEGSILGYWSSLLRGKCSPWKFLSHTVVHVLSGLAAYRLGRMIYTLDLHWTFKQVLSEVDCMSDLKVNLVAGFLIEMLGVTFDLWMFTQRLAKNDVLDLMLKVANTAVIVCLGFGKTGMYINPVLATSFTFGCKGNTSLEHIFVYWAGPFLGVFLAQQLNKVVRLPTWITGREDSDVERPHQDMKGYVHTGNGAGLRKRNLEYVQR